MNRLPFNVSDFPSLSLVAFALGPLLNACIHPALLPKAKEEKWALKRRMADLLLGSSFVLGLRGSALCSVAIAEPVSNNSLHSAPIPH
jgi:hypothetical protein